MNLNQTRIGILHSLVGKNDGVSIVIDQSVQVMQQYLNVSKDNVFFLCAIGPSRVNKMEHPLFWHRSNENRYILRHYSSSPNVSNASPDLEKFIEQNVQECIKQIARFVAKYHVDLLLVHNSCHPMNFIYAVALHRYFKALRQKKRLFPKYLLWWHDSHLERERYNNPNSVVKRYLNFIPGPFVDGLIFINSVQKQLAYQYFKTCNHPHLSTLFGKKMALIPNTCDIPWAWKSAAGRNRLAPKIDDFNHDFFQNIGLIDALQEKGVAIENTLILLQHTRIIQRKRIDTAIDFAFKLASVFAKNHIKKAIVLLVSGYSGDEDNVHLTFLKQHFHEALKKCDLPYNPVILIFAEKHILSEREIIVDKKFYRFQDIPGLVSAHGGIGTYFSEVEGFGNNLLEMVSMGLPVVINEYPIYQSDIRQLGFKFPSIVNNHLTNAFLSEVFHLVTHPQKKRELIIHNLRVLEEKLNHCLMAHKLKSVLLKTLNYL